MLLLYSMYGTDFTVLGARVYNTLEWESRTRLRADRNSEYPEFLRIQERLQKAMEVYPAPTSSPVALPWARAVRTGGGSHPSLRCCKAAPRVWERKKGWEGTRASWGQCCSPGAFPSDRFSFVFCLSVYKPRYSEYWFWEDQHPQQTPEVSAAITTLLTVIIQISLQEQCQWWVAVGALSWALCVLVKARRQPCLTGSNAAGLCVFWHFDCLLVQVGEEWWSNNLTLIFSH